MDKQIKEVGRKPLYDTRMKNYQVILDLDTVRKAKELGNGNLSKGIRLMFELAYPRKEG